MTTRPLPPPPSGFRQEKDEDESPFPDPPKTPEELQEEFDWRTKLRTDAVTLAEKWAEDFEVDKFAMDAFVRSNIDGAIEFVTKNVLQPRSRKVHTSGGDYWEGWEPSSPEDWQEVYDAATTWYSIQLGFDLNAPRQSRGSGRTGTRGPTAEDIRNQYDEDELTEGVDNMWRAYLVEEAPNARGIARQYINSVVQGRGEKNIDFETYVLGHIRNTPSYKRIYRNKGEGVTEQQYLQPYIQAAMQVVGGGDELQSVTQGGAALGTNPEAFRERLGRTDAARNSRGFMQRLEEEVGNLNNVLRG